MKEKTELKSLLASPIARIVLFFWVIIFPIVFVALPLVKVATGEGAMTMQPIWALIAWVLSPLVGMIVLKYLNGQK